MHRLIKYISEDKELAGLLSAIDNGGCPAVLSGTAEIHRAQAAAAIHADSKRPVVVICADDSEAARMAENLSALAEFTVPVLSAREFVFLDTESASRAEEQRRLAVLYKLQTDECPLLVATVEGLLQRTLPPERLTSAVMTVRTGESVPTEDLTAALIRAGYSRTEQVEGPGQFCVRGGIFDIFSPLYAQPVRCEFFDDEIDSAGFFEISSQRRTEMTEAFTVVPVAETLTTLYEGGNAGFAEAMTELETKMRRRKNIPPAWFTHLSTDRERLISGRGLPAADRYMALLYPMATALNYLPGDAVVLLSDPKKLEERLKNSQMRGKTELTGMLENGLLLGELAEFSLDRDDFIRELENFAVVMADNFTARTYPLQPRSLHQLLTKQLASYAGSLETAAGDITHYLKSGWRVAVLCPDKRRGEILYDHLSGYGIPCQLDTIFETALEPGVCKIVCGASGSGYEYTGLQLAVICESQLTAKQARSRPRKAKADSNRQKLESYTDLTPGDLVVHEQYGIGRFVGIFQMTVDKVIKDYIKIAYAGTDNLYVPATSLDMVSKYIGGGEGQTVHLSKMGGTDWARSKSKAKAATREMAKQLLEVQAERKRLAGYAFSPDTVWQNDFESAFPYEETEDQLRCAKEIKADMEKPVPMDRLLCGDVGYGKTEVALRAVMKCVMDGKQAAILVPTTILAQQHYSTIRKRFEDFPVTVELVSRYQTPNQMKKITRELKEGKIDVVVGTHRLLGKEIGFKALGLVVVDEEQRFGVTHKERLKEMSRQVDVLTLSATPIPRTLNMALSGLRDLSTLEEPPQDRWPVQTYVMEHDWGMVCDAIRREIERGGQVFYLHNRIDNIERTAARLAGMLPDVSFGVAHGCMDETQLTAVMEKLIVGETQVLVCTTIIESGIDIPNVNTLIVEDADKLGLAQMHQLRGRVGRSSRRAYAYLTFRQGKALNETAEKRLSAIREFAEFNSGFKIAMRDLEIRGAGNLLGAEQSGHMLSVGYDLYLKLLEEAVLEEKGELPKRSEDCSADLNVSANIPESYVRSPEQRMDLYRRIAHIRSEEDADDMTDELIDRFGDPPRSVNTLIYIALLRGEASAVAIREIAQKQDRLIFKLDSFDFACVSALYNREAYRNRLKLEAGASPAISLKLIPGRDVVTDALQLVRAYRSELELGTKGK